MGNKVWDQAVEGTAVVEAGCTEGEEVLSGLGDGLAEYLELEITFAGVQLPDVSILLLC